MEGSEFETLEALAALTDVLKDRFATGSLFALKDPRTPALMPLWRAAAAANGFRLRVLLAIRRPADVAAGALYLASDEASHVTGIVLPVDAGMTGAGGHSPFAGGRYEEPTALFEAGRRVPAAGD